MIISKGEREQLKSAIRAMEFSFREVSDVCARTPDGNLAAQLDIARVILAALIDDVSGIEQRSETIDVSGYHDYLKWVW